MFSVTANALLDCTVILSLVVILLLPGSQTVNIILGRKIYIVVINLGHKNIFHPFLYLRTCHWVLKAQTDTYESTSILTQHCFSTCSEVMQSGGSKGVKPQKDTCMLYFTEYSSSSAKCTLKMRNL